MPASQVRVLRITGLPREMASRAIDAVLGNDPHVLAIDAVEAGPDDPQRYALHILADAVGVERIRHKVAIGLGFVDIDDVTDTSEAARAPTARLCARRLMNLGPTVTVEPRRIRERLSSRPRRHQL